MPFCIFGGFGSSSVRHINKVFRLRHRLSEAEQKQLGANRVIVYVWTSQYLTNSGIGEAGHVSVEITRYNEHGTQTNNTYISFWPNMNLDASEWPVNRARPIFITDNINNRWSFIEDYTGDRLLEYRKPEYVFCFYTLETSEIVDIFKSFKENAAITWNLYGEYFQRTSDDIVNYS